MKPITVLIVDDSALIRQLFREILSAEEGIEVLDTAADTVEAREKIKRLNPDVLTLDIEMPGMDGISFLEKIMSLRPMPVIMISTLTQKGATQTIKALELGAVDYISKPTGAQTRNALAQLQEELVIKVRAAAKANLSSSRMHHIAAKPGLLSFKQPKNPMYHLIAMGASTGGVEALRDIFQLLPGNLPPIVVVQHMPEQFTPSFAARLNGISAVTIKEAADGEILKPGNAYIAPGNYHLQVDKKSGGKMVCVLNSEEKVSGHRPSVDVLFHSVTNINAAHTVGVILTGMGKDGADGLLAMRNKGAYTIGQSQNSCVVYGMPKAAATAGAVISERPLSEIAAHIVEICMQERKESNVS